MLNNQAIQLRQQLLQKFTNDYQIQIESSYFDFESNDFVFIFSDSVSVTDRISLLNYSTELAGYDVEKLESLVGKIPNWEGLVKALRESSAWEFSYLMAKESLAVNAAWTFLLISLTASKELFSLRASLNDLRAELLEYSRDFSVAELDEIRQALILSDFDPSYLLL